MLKTHSYCSAANEFIFCTLLNAAIIFHSSHFKNQQGETVHIFYYMRKKSIRYLFYTRNYFKSEFIVKIVCLFFLSRKPCSTQINVYTYKYMNARLYSLYTYININIYKFKYIPNYVNINIKIRQLNYFVYFAKALSGGGTSTYV